MKKTATEISHMLFARLWDDYIRRISYARIYEQLVKDRGGNVIHDHVAFRSFNVHSGEQPEGIEAVAHLFEYLGYRAAGEYQFPHTHLYARHFEHADKTLPRLFISQLQVDQLPGWAKHLISDTVSETLYLIPDAGIELMNRLKADGQLNSEAVKILVDDLAGYFRRPWAPPLKDAVLRINDVSQYAAWVLLHGNAVNHFAARVGQNDLADLSDLESTCEVLAGAGVPMKDSIEGERGSKLRQSATHAVKEVVEVKGDDGLEKIEWTYAYYELAERGYEYLDGQPVLFEGFLGPQASHLFNMTRTRDN